MYEDEAAKLLTTMLTVIDDIWPMVVNGIQVSDEDPYYPLSIQQQVTTGVITGLDEEEEQEDLTTAIQIISKALQQCFSHQEPAAFIVRPSYPGAWWSKWMMDWEHWENNIDEIPDDRHGGEWPWKYVMRTQFIPRMHHTFSNYNTVLDFQFIYEMSPGYAKIIFNLHPQAPPRRTLVGYVRDWIQRNPAVAQDGIPEHLMVSQHPHLGLGVWDTII